MADENVKNLKADVVVVGAGSAGLSAALTAASGGAKVIVFEKMPMPGGYTLFSEGMFAAESVLQIKENIRVTKDESFKAHMEGTMWKADGRLVRTFIDKSANTIDWLLDVGVKFEKVFALWPGAPRTWHFVEGGGKALVQVLAQKAGEKGVQMFMETPAEKLVMDEKNRIAGIVARGKDGNTIRVDTRVVIIAGGGFGANPEMMKKHTNLSFPVPPVIPFPQTGDPTRMAWDVGAAAKDPHVLLSVPAVPGEKPDSHLLAAASQPLLLVNKSLERFCDETIFFRFPVMANALSNQEDGVMYTIFDETTKKKLQERGTDAYLGAAFPVRTKLVKLDDDIKRGIEEGKAFAADSIKELAQKIPGNSETLQATVDEYNMFCRENYDRIFGKERSYLQPVKDKKFYAVKSTLHTFSTLGGIKINNRTEVENEKFETIPGLYAVGNCAGGMYGLAYEISSSGFALGFAVTSGCIAGENSLKYLGST